MSITKVDPKFTKEVSSALSLQTEKNSLKTIFKKDLRFTLCDRSDTSDKKGNYFASFNLPTSPNQLTTGSTLSLKFPELQQLNVDRIIMTSINSINFSEAIDGRSLTFSFPQISTSNTQTTMSAVSIVSSTYTSDKILKYESSPLLGDNIVFLFSDSINKPYSGKTLTEHGDVVDESTTLSWDPTDNYLDRPSAVSYQEVNDKRTYGTDLRTKVKYSVNVGGNTYPDNRSGYNYDIPVGFAFIDSGIVVVTHTGLTTNFPWQSGFTSNDAKYVENSDVSGKTNVYFTGTTDASGSQDEAAQLTFTDINTSFQTNVICLAMPREFYLSNNPTWNRQKALASMNEDTGVLNFDSVFVSEIGLYNALGELIATAKLSELVEKNYVNLLTFTLEIDS